MDSGRVHLPPIQDILCRPLSFTDSKDSYVPSTNNYQSDWEKQRSAKEPLHHSRSYSDQILPRRSSASGSSMVQAVDPPHLHRRTVSDTKKIFDEQVPPLQINNNRYKCNQCSKTFSRPSSLRIHILSHTGEKPHVCPQAGCGRRFSVQSNMRRHLKVHYCNPQHPSQENYITRLQK
ncbi:hypothetical protein INT47_008297 [Mucor saturninus]|uniref:C2H2-type domain-containing protein n=1 Tax=Mucor saturninus TaxID=64648 RepID=A0A8H7VCJ9_9FUNG|nr:hypothetical protein INT47_008297 [Mucor saturninus]